MPADNDAIPLSPDFAPGQEQQLRLLYAKLSAIDSLIRSLQNYDRFRVPLDPEPKRKLA
jgi:hypothetical protein